MAFETDLIRRYTGAFTKNDCERIIDGVKFFEENNLLFYDKNILDRQDHKVINVTHEYNFSMSSRICDEMFPKLKPKSRPVQSYALSCSYLSPSFPGLMSSIVSLLILS